MDGSTAELALDAVRVLTYVGYVLLAGTLIFWVLVLPSGSRHRLMALTAISGSTLLVLATVAEPAVHLWLASGAEPAVSRVEGTSLLLRLAALACLAGFFSDLVDRPVVGRRRVAAVIAVIVVTATIAVPMAVEYAKAPGDGPLVAWTLASAGELLGAAGWLGGLVALTVLIVANQDLSRLEGVVPRYSRVVAGCLVVLAATAAFEVVTLVVVGAGGRGTAYTELVLLKAGALAVMLLLATYGRFSHPAAPQQRLRSVEQTAHSTSLSQTPAMVRLELVVGSVVVLASCAVIVVRAGG